MTQAGLEALHAAGPLAFTTLSLLAGLALATPSPGAETGALEGVVATKRSVL